MTLSVFGTSSKKNEKRIPIHPKHFDSIPKHILKEMYFEEGYASDFGFDIEDYDVKGIVSRNELFNLSKNLLLPKPEMDDFALMNEGSLIWGWPHCVQGTEVTQCAIDKKLTLVAFESMHGVNKHHIFHKNNEMAGNASVMHALQLKGIMPLFGSQLKVAVFGFGSTARGAIHALIGLGVNDITVYTKRPTHMVANQIPQIKYEQLSHHPVTRALTTNNNGLFDEVKNCDVIVNCVLQDVKNPLMFILNEQVQLLKDNMLIVDVSCDTQMGFEFACPTSLDSPIFNVLGSSVSYYGVDHTPSLYWNTSSFELSTSLLPYLHYFINDDYSFYENTVLQRATEIKDGLILNKDIFQFQNRSNEYPFDMLKELK